MLVLSRKEGQSLVLDGEIEIKITEISANQVKIGIIAPPNVKVYRQEIYATIEENQKASQATSSDAVKNLIFQMK